MNTIPTTYSLHDAKNMEVLRYKPYSVSLNAYETFTGKNRLIAIKNMIFVSR